MAGAVPVAELNAGFSSPGATARPWAEVSDVLTRAGIFWLSTVRGDGRPHVTPLPAVWHEGTLHFCIGDQEQKTRNLAANPRCVLTTGTPELRSGLDVVVEGTAVRVTDPGRLKRLAELWQERHDWPYEVGENGFAGEAGRTVLVFGVTPEKVLAFGKGEPFSQTRYRF
jgi:nitroimidazol reductase NimA-like FMN-containing flavoprotein (pyridoxamine 5'-phosphate oxidase superfamily)